MIWFRKFAAMLLISFGAALAYLPFPTQLGGERTREIVHLKVRPAPMTEESARARFGNSFITLRTDAMDGFPDVREAILGLAGESGAGCVPPDQWRAFLADRSISDPIGLVYGFRDGLHRIERVETEHFESVGLLVCFEAALLGAYDNPDWGAMARPDAGVVDDYPEIEAELKRLAAGPIPAEGGRSISPRQWRRFDRRELDGFGALQKFVVFDRLFSGVVLDEEAPWSLQTPWLRQVARTVGIFSVFLGMTLGVFAYKKNAARPGIPISSAWLTVFCDVISLCGSVLFVTVALDALWVGPLKQPSLLGLEPEWVGSSPITGLHFVSVLAVFLAAPLLTLWFTSLSAQRIQIDDEGVTSHGALGSASILWNDLEIVTLREQRNPFSFTVVDFRKLQKVLDLEGAERIITINEPGSSKRKRTIINALRQFSPEAKTGLFNDAEVEW